MTAEPTDEDRGVAELILRTRKTDAERVETIAEAFANAREIGRQEILESLGSELASHARALADSLEGDLGLARLIVERLGDYGVDS